MLTLNILLLGTEKRTFPTAEKVTRVSSTPAIGTKTGTGKEKETKTGTEWLVTGKTKTVRVTTTSTWMEKTTH